MLLAPFATTTHHSSRSFGASSTAPGLPSDVGQDRRMEGHHSESHWLCQRRHSVAAEYIVAAAGLPGTSRWRQNWWGYNHHALSTLKAKIADSLDPSRQRLHRIIGSTSSSRSTPSSSRTTARRRSYLHRAPKRSATSIGPAHWALCRHACAWGTRRLAVRGRLPCVHS